MVLAEQLVNLDAEDIGESSHPYDCCVCGRGFYSRERKSWRRTVCTLLLDTMAKTARFLHPFSTMLANWEFGQRRIDWMRSFYCPPLVLFWGEVFLEAFFPRVGFARWNHRGGLSAAVVAAAVAACVFCAAALFYEILAADVIAVVIGFVGEFDVHVFVLFGGRRVVLKKYH